MPHPARRPRRLPPLSAVALAAALSACATAQPPRDVAPGAATPVAEVFWISRCVSMLREVVGATPSAGMQGLELGIERNRMVQPQQCAPGVLVPGAVITVRITEPVAAPELRDIEFLVTYDTMSGPQTSRHARSVRLLPASAPRPGG
jgi:hypothetical protein